jgi:hypothetical protein
MAHVDPRTRSARYLRGNTRGKHEHTGSQGDGVYLRQDHEGRWSDLRALEQAGNLELVDSGPIPGTDLSKLCMPTALGISSALGRCRPAVDGARVQLDKV